MFCSNYNYFFLVNLLKRKCTLVCVCARVCEEVPLFNKNTKRSTTSAPTFLNLLLFTAATHAGGDQVPNIMTQGNQSLSFTVHPHLQVGQNAKLVVHLIGPWQEGMCLCVWGVTSLTDHGGTDNLTAEGQERRGGGRVNVRERRRSPASAPAVPGSIDRYDSADRRGRSPTSALHFSISAAINRHELNLTCW